MFSSLVVPNLFSKKNTELFVVQKANVLDYILTISCTLTDQFMLIKFWTKVFLFSLIIWRIPRKIILLLYIFVLFYCNCNKRLNNVDILVLEIKNEWVALPYYRVHSQWASLISWLDPWLSKYLLLNLWINWILNW